MKTNENNEEALTTNNKQWQSRNTARNNDTPYENIENSEQTMKHNENNDDTMKQQWNFKSKQWNQRRPMKY